MLGFGQLRISHVRPESDLRPALLMLGPGDMLRSEHMSGQRDMPDISLLPRSRRYLRWPGVMPWSTDMSGYFDLRHEHLPRWSNLPRLVFMSWIRNLPG
jgi:hypothetical protein